MSRSARSSPWGSLLFIPLINNNIYGKTHYFMEIALGFERSAKERSSSGYQAGLGGFERSSTRVGGYSCAGNRAVSQQQCGYHVGLHLGIGRSPQGLRRSSGTRSGCQRYRAAEYRSTNLSGLRAMRKIIVCCLLITMSCAAFARPQRREVVVDTVCNTSLKELLLVADRFCYQFQACPDSLFCYPVALQRPRL